MSDQQINEQCASEEADEEAMSDAKLYKRLAQLFEENQRLQATVEQKRIAELEAALAQAARWSAESSGSCPGEWEWEHPETCEIACDKMEQSEDARGECWKLFFIDGAKQYFEESDLRFEERRKQIFCAQALDNQSAP